MLRADEVDAGTEAEAGERGARQADVDLGVDLSYPHEREDGGEDRAAARVLRYRIPVHRCFLSSNKEGAARPPPQATALATVGRETGQPVFVITARLPRT